MTDTTFAAIREDLASLIVATTIAGPHIDTARTLILAANQVRHSIRKVGRAQRAESMTLDGDAMLAVGLSARDTLTEADAVEAAVAAFRYDVDHGRASAHETFAAALTVVRRNL